MRETLDCGVLMVPPHHGWMHEWIGRHGQALGRLRLYPVHFDEKTLGGPADPAAPSAASSAAGAAPPAEAPVTEVPAEVLARLAIPLRRYDVCVLPVTPATVAWTRTALACARAQLHTPLLALARGLKAAAVQDLLGLGLQDFALHRACADELRARLSRLAESASRPDSPPAVYTLQPAAALSVNDVMATYDLSGKAAGLGEVRRSVPMEWGRAAKAAADGAREDDPDAISFLDEIAGHGRGPRRMGACEPGTRIAPNEPFRVAKSRVVGCFERDYVRTALSRHAGNVASAARASAKHRRAFWALMRKHAIDADPYRSHEEDDGDEDGLSSLSGLSSGPGGP
ncbi:hypothetical protein CAL29_28520 [Bordetella genomosp. 10]|uniref:Uncharacterized protein n=1 Tax=Bordetella genomosp. 10 TaxID=1416804 RepID=A0A261S4C6_9BORD|nr:hypothetical protein [Bordetella genomosp. 10]OZI31812.1 hypothetical protein CAL29_28520 [Bordetella genomosp. 10]